MKKKKKLKKKVILFLVIFLALFGGVFSFYVYREDLKEKEQKRLEFEKKQKIKEISSHFSNIVEFNNNAVMYEENNGKYVEVATISSGERVILDDCDINEKTKYFKIKDNEYYVSYNDVKPVDTFNNKNDRYKNYLVFNENIVSKENAKLYRDGKLVYTVKKSFEEEIIIKDDNGYYIEYLNELLFINNDDVLNVKEVNNTTLKEASAVPVTVYHFIYLEGDNTCGEAICHSEKQIREHFTYLNENNFFTMNTTELRLYLEGKLRVPEKSILITIDDGARAWNFVPLLEEFKINATLFLISSWYDKERFASPYMEIASHTHNLHTPRVCPGGQGSPLKCLDKEKLVSDLKQSRETLDGTETFCFPFYEYNDYGISALQEAGFKMAFIGGYRKVTKGVNLYKIPRIPLTGYTTLEQYAKYIN